MKVLVVGAANNASLCILQSLGNAGIKVDVIAERGEFNKAVYSRHVSRKIFVSPLNSSLEEFKENMVHTINDGEYNLVIPSNDRYALLLSLPEIRDRVKVSQLAIPENKILDNVMDKAATLRLAENVGCPFPETKFTTEEFVTRIDSEVEKLKYPVVLKPRYSWYIKDDVLVKGMPVFVYEPKELKERYIELHAQIPFPMIQEQINGNGWGLELLFWDGRVEVAFAHKRIRESNPLGSYSSAVESISVDDVYLDYATRMLEAIDWMGVCMFEFKNDDADGNRPKLMEINGRFWGSLPVALQSKVDFPRYLVAKYNNEEIPDNLCYQAGVKCRWLIADMVHLFHVLRGKPMNWVGYFPGRLDTVIEFFKFFKYASYNCDKWDVMPAFMELVIEPFRKLKKVLFR